MVWHMWWLAILGVLLIALTLIVRSSDDDTEYLLPASEVEKIETRRLQEMTRAPRPDPTQHSSAIAGAALPGQAS
jgi:cytochrome o ubiquinol oxidase subunit 1